MTIISWSPNLEPIWDHCFSLISLCAGWHITAMILTYFNMWRDWVSEVAQSCLTLCDPMDCSLPHSSIHGIFQARVLEWIAISFSRGPSRPRDQIEVSCVAGRRFNLWATREARILEWVAISFSNAWKWKVKVKSLSRVRLFTTPWTAAYQAPPSIGFSR